MKHISINKYIQTQIVQIWIWIWILRCFMHTCGVHEHPDAVGPGDGIAQEPLERPLHVSEGGHQDPGT